MKKIAKRFVLLLAITTIALPNGTFVNADEDDRKPEKVVKITCSDRTLRVGSEFELYAQTSPYDADDDSLVWSIVGKKGIIRFDDDDRNDDEAEFVALKTGTTKVRCSIRGKGKKYSKTYTVKVKKNSGSSKISRVGAKIRRVECDDDFELKVKKSRGLSDKYLKWTIADKSIVDFEDNDRTDNEVEFEALRVGKTTVTCKNTKTGKTVRFTVQVVPDYDD